MAFKPGQSGNPKGRPPGSRDKLRSRFFFALAEDFQKHGPDALVKMREADPSGYIRAIASLMPKDLEVTHHKHPLDGMSDEQLAAIVDATERLLAKSAGEAIIETEPSAQELGAVH